MRAFYQIRLQFCAFEARSHALTSAPARRNAKILTVADERFEGSPLPIRPFIARTWRLRNCFRLCELSP